MDGAVVVEDGARNVGEVGKVVMVSAEGPWR